METKVNKTRWGRSDRVRFDESIEDCSNNRCFKQLTHLLKCYPFAHRSRDVIKKIGQLSECRSLLSYQKQLESA